MGTQRTLNMTELMADLSVLSKVGDIKLTRKYNTYTIEKSFSTDKFTFIIGAEKENIAFDFTVNGRKIYPPTVAEFIRTIEDSSNSEQQEAESRYEQEEKARLRREGQKLEGEFPKPDENFDNDAADALRYAVGALEQENPYEKNKKQVKAKPVKKEQEEQENNFDESDLDAAAAKFAKAIAQRQANDKNVHAKIASLEEMIKNIGAPSPKEIIINDLPKVNLGENSCAILEDLLRAAYTGQNAYIFGPAGCGKCHKIDTPILMFDGTIKMVQDVVVGDQLMGPDSKPRNVLSLARGREEMFDVVPVKGDTWGCNRSHILSLVNTTTSKIVNISVNDYLSKSNDFKNNHKQYRSGVDFAHKDVALDPYFVGLWLGDGSTDSVVISNPDKEIHEYLFSISGLLGTETKKRNLSDPKKCPQISLTNGNVGGGKNLVADELKKCGLGDDKIIHDDYLINSRENRLKLLAGLIDSDGYNHSGNCEITSVSKKLAEQYAFLARSLGFAAYISEKISTIKSTGFSGLYFRVVISGDLSVIPTKVERKKFNPRLQKKDVLRTGFELFSTGVDNYYGFELDGDNLYLLGDFTVTHNTTAAKQVAKAMNLPFGYICLTAGASETWLFGRNTPNGFIEGEFSKLYKNGGVFLADEMDAADSNLLIALNTAIDSDQLLNPMSGEVIKKHKDFVFIGAGNTNGLGATGQHNGRNKLDASTLSRFVFFEMDYNEQLEKNLCLDSNIYEGLIKTRRYLTGRKSENFITTRDFIKLSKMLVSGSSYEFVANSLTANFSEVERKEVKAFFKFKPAIKKQEVTQDEIHF